MDTETLKWLFNEFRSMARDLAIWEMRQQTNELMRTNEELVSELRRATELAERLSADVKSLVETNRQIEAQANHIANLESQIENVEFKRGLLESENHELSRKNESLYEIKQELEARLFDLESPTPSDDKGSEESKDNEDD
jgi:uncharacterized protein (DUF3084 family)